MNLDTANTAKIKKGISAGVISGVTTNPSIIAKENKPFENCVLDIVNLDPGLTVLAEVVKIPMIPEGLAVVDLAGVLDQEYHLPIIRVEL